MKLAKIYSQATGLELNKPDLYEQFIPNTFDKYIVFHASGGKVIENNGQKIQQFSSKIYDYYQEVINLIKPLLIDYKIIQIGVETDEQLQNIDLDLRGKTNIAQANYLIKNCALFIGNDSMFSHTTGLYEVPMVVLYGGTSKPHFPFWFNKDKSIFLESDRNGKLPSFQMQEFPKTINMIKPETVVRAILNLLDLKWPNPIKTLHIGSNYKGAVIEMIPNQVIVPNFFNGVPTIRGDYYFNEENILNQLKLCKCTVVLGQPIDINNLIPLKQNIALISLNIDKFPSLISYIKSIIKAGIQFTLFSEIQDDNELNKFKLELYEYSIINKMPFVDRKSLEFLANLNYTKSRLKTNHLLLSGEKVYASKAHWLANSPCELQNSESRILDNQTFINEVENLFIYQYE